MSTQKPTLSSFFMFCMENVHGLPDDMQDPKLAREAQQLFASPYMRVNTTTDVTGVEICGALKNVLAIAAGIVEGLDLGHNAMAALVAQVRQTLLAAEQNRKGKERKGKETTERKGNERKRKYYTFWRQFNEKPHIISGCSGLLAASVCGSSQALHSLDCKTALHMYLDYKTALHMCMDCKTALHTCQAT